ncbi:MAG: YqfO family protein [Pseudomonadales bacterium]|nr:YqfO family protein [Pseudomonadales bacterium]
MYKIVVYVPEENLDEVKNALFSSGAGKIGEYDHCCWQVKGVGQFRPLSGSNPYIGSQGEIEKVSEYRVELVCSDEFIKPAILAMKKAHPYEEPAYDVWRLEVF